MNESRDEFARVELAKVEFAREVMRSTRVLVFSLAIIGAAVIVALAIVSP